MVGELVAEMSPIRCLLIILGLWLLVGMIDAGIEKDEVITKAEYARTQYAQSFDARNGAKQ